MKERGTMYDFRWREERKCMTLGERKKKLISNSDFRCREEETFITFGEGRKKIIMIFRGWEKENNDFIGREVGKSLLFWGKGKEEKCMISG